MSQINSRHKFLDGFLGTKPEEDISHAKANEVNLWITVTTCLCCVLEIVLYFLYNRMVNNKYYRYELQFHLQIHPWLPILNGITQEEDQAEENKGEEIKLEENQAEEDKPEENQEEEEKAEKNKSEENQEEDNKSEENQEEDNKSEDNKAKGEGEMAKEIKKGDPRK